MDRDKKIKGMVKFPLGLPMELPAKETANLTSLPEDIQLRIKQVAETIKAYQFEAIDLLDNKYSNLKNIAPVHLTDPGVTLVVCCSDGIIIRFEKKYEEKGLACAWAEENIDQLAPILSENVIHCHYAENLEQIEMKYGPRLTLSKREKKSGKSIVFSEIKIGFNALIKKRQDDLPPPPKKPFCLLSVYNDMEFQLLGELSEDSPGLKKGQRFMTITKIRLPVGWECIEIYPYFDLDSWKPEYAKTWAERDILSAVLRQKTRESELTSLDPNVNARKHFSRLLSSYNTLLESMPEREEVLQVFLKENPTLLCPTYTKMWPKLPFGRKITDFVFLDAYGEYTLVELEKPQDRLFIKNGDTSKELNHAQNQILDWKRYIEDNLSTVQKELGLSRISTNPKGIIVIGRSSSLNEENIRKLASIQNESPKLQILTYDDIFINAKTLIENHLGPLSEETGSTNIYYLPQRWINM